MNKQPSLLNVIPKTLVSNDTREKLPGLNPYLTTNRGILLNLDCISVLSKIKSESIHCVFADPPFNLKKNYHNGISDDLVEEEYLKWSFEWIDECV